MFRLFQAATADEVWLKIAGEFKNDSDGLTREQSSRAGHTQEILHAALSIAEPRQRWVFSRIPPMNPAFAIAEVVWIVAGRNDSRFLTFFNQALPQYAGSGENFHGAYGYRLRRHLNIDQLTRAFEALRHNPDSRQVVLQIWDSKVDLPDYEGQPSSADIPCNVLSMLKIRDGILEWTQIVRSNDLYKGLPYNLVQFTMLQEVLAGWLSVETGTYNQISDSLHVYGEELQYIVDSKPVTVPLGEDRLALSKEESEAGFGELARRIERIISPDLSPLELERIAKWDGPLGFTNMLALLSAEGARRRKWLGLSDEIMASCKNESFNLLWSRWRSRFAREASSEEP